MSFSSKELFAAASTTFSDENYFMTLFSEYRIEVVVNSTESKSFLAGQFPHLYQKKGCHEKSYLFSSYQVKIGCIFQKKKHVVFSSKYFELGCVFISNTGKDREQGIPKRRFRPGSSLQQVNLVFRRKLHHDFIFGISY